MLTSELVRPRLRLSGTTVTVDFVDSTDPTIRQTAQDLINLFQANQGQTQAYWENKLTHYEGSRLDYIVIRGLAKVLADSADFTPRPTAITPGKIREEMFAYGPVFAQNDMTHPFSRHDALQTAAGQLDLSPADIEELLFADRRAAYVLTTIHTQWNVNILLARYNLELARGVLYWASHLRIEVKGNYKDLFKFIKLFKLMAWIEPSTHGGYRIDLDGPISPFVTSTLRYGRQMAAFLPALFLCDEWQMQATVFPPQTRGEMKYELDHHSALSSHFKRSGEFDSRLEADFAHDFAQKIGEKRGHWRLERENTLLPLGDTVMVPDFLLTDTRDATRTILIELVGYWHPHYLRRKVEKVQAARCARLLLLVYKGLNITEEDFQGSESELLFFTNKPVIKEVLEVVDAMAEKLYGKIEKKPGTH